MNLKSLKKSGRCLLLILSPKKQINEIGSGKKRFPKQTSNKNLPNGGTPVSLCLLKAKFWMKLSGLWLVRSRFLLKLSLILFCKKRRKDNSIIEVSGQSYTAYICFNFSSEWHKTFRDPEIFFSLFIQCFSRNTTKII